MDRKTKARNDLSAYAKAMLSNNIERCIDIELAYGLAGYPPSAVAIGLKAAAEGVDVQHAIDTYLDGAQS